MNYKQKQYLLIDALEDILERTQESQKLLRQQLRHSPKSDLFVKKNGDYLTPIANIPYAGKRRRMTLKNSDSLVTRLADKHNLQMAQAFADYNIRVLEEAISKIKNPPELRSTLPYLRSHDHALRDARINSLLTKREREMTPEEREWMDADYHKNPYKPEHLIYKTNGGLMVRSKAEQDIANLLEKLNIPFRYDAYVYANGRNFYVDFVILRSDGTELYWEHFGLVGDPEYDKDKPYRLYCFARDGISIGKNLIITFEPDVESEEKIMEVLQRLYY